MYKSRHSQVIIGLILFAIGALIGLVLMMGSVIANLEAANYGFTRVTKEQLPGLQCPVLVTQSVKDKITLSLTNKSDNPANQLVRVEISSRGPFIKQQNQVLLQPGETQHFDWTVTRDNVDLKRFIFFSILVFDGSGSSRQSPCGMVYWDIPFISGRLIISLLVLVSGILLVGGYSLWVANSKPIIDSRLDQSRAMKFLALLILVGMFVSFQGSWLFGGMLLVITVLMLIAVFFLAISGSEKKMPLGTG